MMSVAIILVGVASLTSCIVSARLFALAGRTGNPLARLAAIANSALFCFGFPLAAVSRVPALDGTYEGSLIFTISMIALSIGMAALYRFPQLVFRPSRTWAVVLRNTASTAGAIAGAGCAFGVTMARGPTEMLEDTRPWAVGLMVTIALPFLWNGIESILLYRRMRRRRRLGLPADPVVSHRLLLWACSSWYTVVTLVGVILIRLEGIPIRSPLPLSMIAVGTLVCLGSSGIAFMMPRAYRVHVVGVPDRAPGSDANRTTGETS